MSSEVITSMFAVVFVMDWTVLFAEITVISPMFSSAYAFVVSSSVAVMRLSDLIVMMFPWFVGLAAPNVLIKHNLSIKFDFPLHLDWG